MENANGIPVIPGTSWGGAFRHHMHALLRDTGISEKSNTMKELDRYFGIGYESEEHIKSKLSFSESEIEIKNEKKQKMTTVRTALDRFTASPKQVHFLLVCSMWVEVERLYRHESGIY